MRALVRMEDVDEGKVSRKHALHDHGRRDGVPGIVSVVGGKITGYRAIAEEVGDLILERSRDQQGERHSERQEAAADASQALGSDVVSPGAPFPVDTTPGPGLELYA